MSETTAPSRRIGRSIGAVLLGFVAVGVFHTATDAVMHATGIFPPLGTRMSSALFVWATIYRVGFTVLGGLITAKLAPSNPRKHVIVLGCIGTFFATLGAAATWNMGPEFGPHWYPVALVVTALPAALLGGKLAERRAAPSPA